MKYFTENMNANEVRTRLFDLLYKNRVPEKEIPDVKKEHAQMCKITVAREMKLAADGWMTE